MPGKSEPEGVLSKLDTPQQGLAFAHAVWAAVLIKATEHGLSMGNSARVSCLALGYKALTITNLGIAG
jgi:hypothetical protein